MKKLFFILLSTIIIIGCGQTYEEAKVRTAHERAMLKRQDSLALKIGVLPTIDCLPMYIVKERGWIDTARADVRMKEIESHIAADDALKKGKIEGMATDIVRVRTETSRSGNRIFCNHTFVMAVYYKQKGSIEDFESTHR